MDPDFNPYQAPQSQDYLPQSSTGCWREGNRVFLSEGADLPCRCIRCGAEAEPPRRLRKLYWYHPAWNLLLVPLAFAVLLLALIIALFLRKTIQIRPALCPAHRRQMRWLFWGVPALIGLMLLLPPLLPDGSLNPQAWILWYAGIVLFTLVFVTATSPLHPRVVKMTGEYNVLKGFGQGFLDTLPKKHEADGR